MATMGRFKVNALPTLLIQIKKNGKAGMMYLEWTEKPVWLLTNTSKNIPGRMIKTRKIVQSTLDAFLGFNRNFNYRGHFSKNS